MRYSQDNIKLQCAGLNAVLLMGGYGICGRILTEDAASYGITWLCSVSAAAVIWAAAPQIDPVKVRGTVFFGSFRVLYYLVATALYLRGFIALWQQWALPETPRIILTASAVLLTVYGGRCGSRPVLRLCLPVLFTVMLFFLLDTALLTPEMSASRLEIEKAFVDPSAFFDILAILILPLPAALYSSDLKTVGIRPYFTCGACIGLGYLMLSALRSQMLLGTLTVLDPYPLLKALMLVYVGRGLRRSETWGLMAISGAMLAAAMALMAGALYSFPKKYNKTALRAVMYILLTAAVFF